MARILFAGQPDPGFCIVLLTVLHPHLDGAAQQELACMQFSPLADGLEAARGCGDSYCLLLPTWVNLQADAAVAEDGNAGRCRVAFGCSNATAWPITGQAVAELARDSGISDLRAITLISQNRLLGERDLPIQHLCADAFVGSG